jgi:D-alanyl-D-alanine carboxypeptidase (penicillin-binding protein 5/6)
MINPYTEPRSWVFLTVFAAVVLTAIPRSQAIETQAKQAYLIDVATGSVLLEKNAEQPVAPASMSKLMTIYMVFELLKDGRLSLDDKFVVSKKAWRKGGSKMFVKVNSRVRVEDLLRGIIVQSGNDACIVFAEGLAGSEEAFADQMTKRARELGLTGSTFKNATGWPHPEHLMSARDIAHLSMRMAQDFPEYYSIFSEKNFTYNKIKQGNRNPLLYRDLGADGLKTGYTEASGYGLAASAKRGDRRVVLVVNGLPSVRARSSESLRLIDWAFRAFDNYSLFKKGDTVDQADVWLGTEATVPLIIDRDVRVTLQRRFRRKMTAKIIFTGPIPAPIAKGAPIARLEVTAPEFKTLSIPLHAGIEVGQRGMFGRLGAAFRYMIWGSS